MKARAPIRPTHPRKVKTHQQQNEKNSDEKKVNHNATAKVGRSKRPDIFALQQPLITAFSSMSDVVKAFSNGTDELRSFLNYECELIYECKVCRSLFRSLSNFIQHKKSHCLERTRDLKRQALNGEIIDKVIHINGNSSKGQILSTRKTMRKDIYNLLRKVGSMTDEPVPPQFFTKDISETDAALLSFFNQEGKAATNERTATLDANGSIVRTNGTSDSHEAAPLTNGTPERCESPSDHRSESTFSCTKCCQSFDTREELRGHESSDKCSDELRSELRSSFVCPLCHKDVATPWSVYRHLRRVHNKTSVEARKLRENTVKKLVKLDSKCSSPTSVTKSPNGKETDAEKSPVSRSTIDGSLQHVGFKRSRSPESGVPVKRGILEVSAYDKGPQSLRIASILSLPQPSVLLTKTNFTSIQAAPSCVGSTASPPTNSSPSTANRAQPNPPKRARAVNDLSWLKRGPSVPISGGPLTRTARALYGSPKKINVDSVRPEWQSIGKALGCSKDEDGDSGSPSGQDESADSDHESDPEGASQSDADASEAEDSSGSKNDAFKTRRSFGKVSKAEKMNKQLSSSEDNVPSITNGSVYSCDSSMSKDRSEKPELADLASTSGIETDLSPEGDRPAISSSCSSEDEANSDVDRLIFRYSQGRVSPGTKVHEPAVSLEQSSLTPAFSEAAESPPNVSPSNSKELDCVLNGEQLSKPASETPVIDETKSPPVVVDEREKESSETTFVYESSDISIEDNDEKMRSVMVDVIFGSLPTSSFRLSSLAENDSSS